MPRMRCVLSSALASKWILFSDSSILSAFATHSSSFRLKRIRSKSITSLSRSLMVESRDCDI